MQRLALILINLLVAVTVFAANPRVYEDAKSWYAQGQYEKALQGFKLCKIRYKVADADEWIAKCHKGIRLREEAYARQEKEKRERAEREAEAKRAWEQEQAVRKEKERKRREDNLVCVWSEAYLFDNKIDLHSSVERALSDAGFEQTDDPEAARWTVYITAMAYEEGIEDTTTSKGPQKFYISNVNALVKIEDTVCHKLIFDGEVTTNDKQNFWGISFQQAAQKAYRELKKDISTIIVNKLKTKYQ